MNKKQEQRESRYFYKIGLNIYYIDDNSDVEKQQLVYKKEIRKYNHYEAGKGYETNLESLKQYRADFNKWADEIISDINYRKYYSHDDAVLMVFKSKSTRILNSLNIEPVIFKEFPFLEKCSNGGLISLDLSKKGKQIQCYGYDYSAWYPNLLSKSDLQLPIKQGKRFKIKKLNFPLKYGIYRVIITSEHPEFYKVFSFSEDNKYTHYSLEFCNKYKDEYKIKMTVLNDDWNALIYDDTSIIESKKVFGDWFNHLSKLKAKFPKNKIVKRLMSSLWGNLCQYNRHFFEEEAFFELDVSRLKDEENTKYKLHRSTFATCL
jgi:hypothetical protein